MQTINGDLGRGRCKLEGGSALFGIVCCSKAGSGTETMAAIDESWGTMADDESDARGLLKKLLLSSRANRE